MFLATSSIYFTARETPYDEKVVLYIAAYRPDSYLLASRRNCAYRALCENTCLTSAFFA